VVAGNVTGADGDRPDGGGRQTVSGSGVRDGPVDATFKTIKKLTRTKSKLLQFAINAITGERRPRER